MIRQWMEGWVMVFRMTLSMPMFSVSVFPTMHRPFGARRASSSARETLARVETATWQFLFSGRTKYSPASGGQAAAASEVSPWKGADSDRSGKIPAARLVATAG
jgi:hypothetical protein